MFPGRVSDSSTAAVAVLLNRAGLNLLVPIVFQVERIEEDTRDTGDLARPYDGVDVYIPDDFYGG